MLLTSFSRTYSAVELSASAAVWAAPWIDSPPGRLSAFSWMAEAAESRPLAAEDLFASIISAAARPLPAAPAFTWDAVESVAPSVEDVLLPVGLDGVCIF